MALLPWDDEQKKKDELFSPAIKTVSSVQGGAWQPAPSGADSAVASDDSTDPKANGGIFDQNNQPQGNYLLSDEKAQVDEQLRRRKAQEEAARAEAARQAAIARAQDNARAAAAAQVQSEVQQSTDKSKYSNKGKKQEGGIKGLLKGIAAGIEQAGGNLADVAIKGGGIIDYAGRRLGGTEDGAAAVQSVRDAERARNWLASKKDITGENLRGSRGAEAAANRLNNGTADLRDYATLAGEGLQTGLDATMLVNPARIGIEGVTPVVSKGANILERVLANPAARYAARDAAFFGGAQGAATIASQYGATGDIGDALGTGARDAAIASVLQGSLDLGANTLGNGARSSLPMANRTLNSLRKPRELRLGDEVAQTLEDGAQSPVQRPNEVADGVATPGSQPINDGNVSFEQPNGAADSTPAFQRGFGESVTPVDPKTNEQLAIEANIRRAQGLPPTEDLTPAIDRQTPSGIAPAEIPAPEALPAQTPEVAPVADGVVRPPGVTPVTNANTPVVPTEQVRALQESIPGKSQADEAAINQELQQTQAQVPQIIEPKAQSLPEGVAPVEIDNLPMMKTPSDGKLAPAQVAERLMPKLADNSDVKARIADSVGMGKDTASPIRDILKEGNVKPKQAERIAGQFDQLQGHLADYNHLEELNQKAYAEGGTAALDENVSRERSRAARELGITTRRIMSEIKRVEGSRNYKTRLINGLVDVVGTRNASVLSSAGLLERNIAQELTANAVLAVKNPIKTIKSTFGNGNILKDTAKSELSHWRDAPRNPLEAIKYVVGNTYRTGMIPTTALANTRRGAVRDELTKWAFQELEGRKVSSGEAHKLAGTAGNEMEALVNTFMGVDNGMTNRGQATAALKAWKEYIRTGDTGAKAGFLQKVENHNSLADQMIAGLSKEDQVRGRALMAMKNLIFPFVRTATNLAKTTVRQELNPFAKSLLDEIGADQRSGGVNAIKLIKSKLVDYGIMGGAAALASSGILVYNDGDQIDKPKGWAIKTGDNSYVPVRSTSLELPIALAGTAQQMAKDIGSGHPRDWKYYAGMVTNSLPYIDQFNTVTGAVDSAVNGQDGGYAGKAYGINMAKSLVPFSNNSIQPYVAGKEGKSLNAKSVYDKNLMTWFENAIRKSYDPSFYNSLKDSRDNAGRVRTVDNQGIASNKTINDASTAEYNDRITELVNFGRENGLGKNTQDMFNTYDTGKNNNFKSVQDSITFLDVGDGGKPDSAKKLEKNKKLNDLSRQIRDGFFGDTGNDLLTLNGQNLKSDASVPNKSGSKNSKLPLSMQSIKNAVAQTDLPKDQSDKLYAISGQSTNLYNQLKAKSITYDQYSAAKSKLGAQEINILSGSKNYKKMVSLFDELDQSGFFASDGLGSTKSGQTYLWNSLNALLGSKGATPAANYPDTSTFKPWGNQGTGRSATNKPGDRKNKGIEWAPVGKRQAAGVTIQKYTPVDIKVKLGNAVKKDKTQDYAARSF